MAPRLYHPTKASRILGKMSAPERDATRADFLKTYRTAPPPYFVRCPNIIMHSLDYVDLSAEKRFFKHRQIRPLADIEKKHQAEQRKEPPLLPREGIYGKIVKPFSQTAPIDAVGAGIREVHRHGTALPFSKRKPVSAEQVRPKPATNISRISVAGRTLGRRAWSCGVPPGAQESSSVTERLTSAKDSKSKQRPGSAAIDSHMRIKVDREYLDAVRHGQRLRYELQRHLNPEHNPLGDTSLARSRFCVSHRTRINQLHCRCRAVNPSFYPQEPSKWLGFTGTTPERQDPTGETAISAFFHDSLAHDYSIEHSTGCTVAHNLLEHEHEVMIGINGQLAPSQVSEQEIKARETARSTTYFDDPRVPLCWDDQLHKTGIRVLGVRAKDAETGVKDVLGFERRLMPVPHVPPAQRPKICEIPGSHVTRENQMLQITRHTRALENSKVTQLPSEPTRPFTAIEKSKTNQPLSYDDVLDILRDQAHQKARAEAMAAEEAARQQQQQQEQQQQQKDSHNLGALEKVLAEQTQPAPQPRPSPRPPSPLLSPTGGLVKPFSANSFRSGSSDLQLELRLRLRPKDSGAMREAAKLPNSSRGRLITGARLHKSTAAKGASIGQQSGEEAAEFINIVSPFHLPSNSEALHDVATNMVLQRTFESRNEMVSARPYPCTPVSHRFDDYYSDDDDKAMAPDTERAAPMERSGGSTAEPEASCNTGGTVPSEILETQDTEPLSGVDRTASASSFEPVTIPRADDSTPS